jgi:hypothetical protein
MSSAAIQEKAEGHAANGHAHMKSVDMPSLPTPATQAKSTKFQLSAAAIIPVWIAISSAVIIYNNYVYNTLQFKYPVFLVTFHLTFAVSGPRRFTAAAGRC